MKPVSGFNPSNDSFDPFSFSTTAFMELSGGAHRGLYLGMDSGEGHRGLYLDVVGPTGVTTGVYLFDLGSPEAFRTLQGLPPRVRETVGAVQDWIREPTLQHVLTLSVFLGLPARLAELYGALIQPDDDGLPVAGTEAPNVQPDPQITLPAGDRPTVVVQVSDGGILEAVCADLPVRVILVDYAIDSDDDQARTAPDGDPAIIHEVVYGHPALWTATDPERVAGYEHALAGPLLQEERTTGL